MYWDKNQPKLVKPAGSCFRVKTQRDYKKNLTMVLLGVSLDIFFCQLIHEGINTSWKVWLVFVLPSNTFRELGEGCI